MKSRVRIPIYNSMDPQPQPSSAKVDNRWIWLHFRRFTVKAVLLIRSFFIWGLMRCHRWQPSYNGKSHGKNLGHFLLCMYRVQCTPDINYIQYHIPYCTYLLVYHVFLTRIYFYCGFEKWIDYCSLSLTYLCRAASPPMQYTMSERHRYILYWCNEKLTWWNGEDVKCYFLLIFCHMKLT